MVEAKCIEMDTPHALAPGVIRFLEANPHSVLVRLQRGKVDLETMVRKGLEDSLKKIEKAVQAGDKKPHCRRVTSV